jgi:hypothetical protein
LIFSWGSPQFTFVETVQGKEVEQPASVVAVDELPHPETKYALRPNAMSRTKTNPLFLIVRKPPGENPGCVNSFTLMIRR